MKTTDGVQGGWYEELDTESLVSMNMWGLRLEFWKLWKRIFSFLKKVVPRNPMKAGF